jgi:hypothetical protein
MCGRISAGIRAEQFIHYVPPGHVRRLCFRQDGSVARAVDSFCAMIAQREPEVLPEYQPEIHRAAKVLKMTTMRDDSQRNPNGKSDGFILCVFRAGLPGNPAKVGAVGKIQVVQWVTQKQPEVLQKCQPKHD